MLGTPIIIFSHTPGEIPLKYSYHPYTPNDLPPFATSILSPIHLWTSQTHFQVLLPTPPTTPSLTKNLLKLPYITQYCISTFPQKPHNVPTHDSRSSPPSHTYNGNFCNHQSFPVPYPRLPHHTFTPLKCNLYTSYPPTRVQPLSTQLQNRTPLHSRTLPTP